MAAARLALAQAATVHGDEAGAEALDAGKVLVATRLVNLALASVFGFFRQYRDAERFLAAVAAAFAHQRIDEHAFLRIFQLAALAPAALFGRAGLVVDQHRSAFDFAQTLLHGVEFVAMDEFHVAREDRMIRPLLDVVAHHDDGGDAFAAHLMGDVGYGQLSIHRLPAGHRDRVVVENFVGDVDLGRDGLADRERAGMEIRAVAEVLKHMLRVRERRLPAPGRAFAAHLRERIGAPIHPRHHVMAADAAERARILRHVRRGVVRATRAVMRHAREIRARQGEFMLLRVDPRHARCHRFAGEEARQALGDHQCDHGRRQLVRAGQDPVAVLVVLADDVWATFTILIDTGPVEHVFLHLRFDERTFFFDDDDVFEPTRELADADRFERPGHADLVDANADFARIRFADAEVFQRLQDIEVTFAGGDDAEPRLGRIEHDAIELVRARERAGRLHRVLVQAHFLVQRRIGPADVESAFRHLEIGRDHDVELVRIDNDAGTGFHGFRDRLEADPAPGEAAHRPTEQAHVEDVLHARGIQNRHHRADEFEFRSVRQGRRATGVVVGRKREHAAVFRGARRIAVFEHIATAIDPGAFAVPHRKHAVVLGAGK